MTRNSIPGYNPPQHTNPMGQQQPSLSNSYKVKRNQPKAGEGGKADRHLKTGWQVTARGVCKGIYSPEDSHFEIVNSQDKQKHSKLWERLLPEHLATPTPPWRWGQWLPHRVEVPLSFLWFWHLLPACTALILSFLSHATITGGAAGWPSVPLLW